MLNFFSTKKSGFGSNKRNPHAPDAVLLAAVSILIGLGLVFLSNASAVVGFAKYGSSYHYFNRQLVVLLFGAACLWLMYKIDYAIWKKYSFFLLIVSVCLLGLVFIPSLAAGWGTSRSWINIFGLSLQPSELVKIFFLIYLAAFLESRQKEMGDARQSFWPFLVVFGIIALLMLLQPDLGTLFIIAASAFMVYFAAGGRVAHLAIIVLGGLLAFFIMVQAKPYQMDRFRCVFDSEYNQQKECYQLNQSLIAVGSGGIIGRGIGESRQKFLYLPEVHGDSIFAVIAEEIGLIGGIAFLFIYFLIFYRIMLIASRSPDAFGRLLAIGIGCWFIVQTFLNIGGVIGLIPMTGVPLPLVSQGGSNLLATLIAIGIVLNISRYSVNNRN
jgi:cell division protein FtsW